ncbi:MAG: hypothetical protein HFJ95_07415 [Muribaculaceae bacterium]|nr:hypothetical protein [Muribaculaceae bacterium]
MPTDTTSNRSKIILGVLLVLSIAAFVFFATFAPEASLDLIFCDVKFSLILIFVILFFISLFVRQFDEKRDSPSYISTSGEFDLTSPRCYTPIKVTPISKILGRENIFGQKNLEEFRYADGVLYVRNSAGREIEGPLESLTFSYKVNKDDATDKIYIYQYRITDKNGNKVQYNKHKTMFNDEEFADMEMILSLCGKIDETNFSKFSRKFGKALETIKDLDFHNIAGSATDMVVDAATDKVADKSINYVGKIARARLIKTQKHETFFKKIRKYGLYVIVGIYILAVIIVNISHISDSLTPADEVTEMEMTNETVENKIPSSVWYSFIDLANGGADGIYVCQFLENGKTFYLSVVPEVGGGAYLAPTSDLYGLVIDEENDNRTSFICSTINPETEEPAAIRLSMEFSESLQDVQGKLVGMDGIIYEYSGNLIEAEE